VHTTVDLEASESTIGFVLTSRPCSVAGIVRDANSNPVPEARVAMLPEPLPVALDRFDPRGFRDTITDLAGVFRLADLAPGRYRAVVLTGADREHFRDLGFLIERMRGVEPIVLDFGQTASVELHVK